MPITLLEALGVLVVVVLYSTLVCAVVNIIKDIINKQKSNANLIMQSTQTGVTTYGIITQHKTEAGAIPAKDLKRGERNE